MSDSSGNQLELGLDPPGPGVQLKILPEKVSAASTAFTLTGTQPGASSTVSAFVKGSGRTTRYSADLKVIVGGVPSRQPGHTVDLLANLAANGTPLQIYQHNRIMLDPPTKKHILSQNTERGHFNCGDTAASYGKKIFGQETSTAYYQYYLPATTDQKDDLRFDADRVRQGIAKIKSMVSPGEDRSRLAHSS